MNATTGKTMDSKDLKINPRHFALVLKECAKIYEFEAICYAADGDIQTANEAQHLADWHRRNAKLQNDIAEREEDRKRRLKDRQPKGRAPHYA